MDFWSFITNKALILIPILWIIGMFLKQTPKIPNWLIPWVLMAVGIVGANIALGVSVDSLVQGILVAGASVMGHQIVKQTKRRD